MTTKAELVKKIEVLESSLEKELSRPTRHTISSCSVDMTKPDETKLAVAKAVTEGMKALQSLGGEVYGVYIAAPSESD